MSQCEPTEVSDRLHRIDRRMFCVSAMAAGVALACGGGGSAAAPVAPTPPPPGPRATTDTKAALLATPNGTARDYRDLGGFFLLKDAAGIYALTTICTHMGCTVGVPVGTVITCPCHGSQYDLGGGNLLGPATLPLVHFSVTEPTPGADLVVNTAQTVSASARLT